MKKTDKKIENNLIAALNEVCQIALDQVAGFEWITHLVNYSNFPNSLSVICVFDTNQALAEAKANEQDVFLAQIIKQKLAALGIKIKDTKYHVSFDTEQACLSEHGGQWQQRFK